MRGRRAQAEPTGFFVIRTPLLPLEELRAWSRGLRDRDDADARKILRTRMRALLERPEIEEAVYIASPTLHAAIGDWRADPSSPRGRKAERSLVRYLARMCSRATPFGLLAGYSVGTIGDETTLHVPPRSTYRRRTRLDMSYLSAVAEAAETLPGFQEEARYFPNRTIYRAAGRLHYVERAAAEGRRKVVAAAETPPLAATLDKAAEGARLEELVQTLVESGAPATRAREYVVALVEARALEPGLDPPVTGAPALGSVIAALDEQESTARAAALLREAQAGLHELDGEALGVSIQRYRSIGAKLEQLGVPIVAGRLFQVDMAKPAATCPSLSRRAVDELLLGVERLRLLAPPRSDPLAALRERFRDRYEDRTVPLLEAFDDEAGVGLETLPEPPADGGAPEAASWGRRETLLLRKLTEAARVGATEIELTDGEVTAAAPERPAELPGAFAVMATLVGEPGRPELVFLHGAFGPSGARMLARFCDADEELRHGVERHLRDEEALEPDAVFAEVAHLPTARHGNVVRRPTLREYEIDYLGPSGAPQQRRIPVSDLLVTLDSERFVLHSERLGRRVVPRISSAVGLDRTVPPLFRLLGMLQDQGSSRLSFDWGPLGHAAIVPRVRAGRTVLAPARWQIGAVDAPSTSALRQLRRERGMPRFVAVLDRGRPLTVDLDNVLSVDGLLSILRLRGTVTAFEVPGPVDGLCAEGPDGQFVHELLVPFTGLRQRWATAARLPVDRRTAAGVQRRFPPGSEWLYAKLYGGRSAVERSLCDSVAPLCARLRAAGVVDRWHFLRYGDPEYHLRLRLHGEAAALHGEALPELQRLAAGEIDAGRVWRFTLDTYERELERYGGPAAIEMVETIFTADSEAVAEILADADVAADRLTAVVLGAGALLDELGLDLAGKREVAARLVSGLRGRLPSGILTRAELAAELRRERPRLEAAWRALREGRPPHLSAALRTRAEAISAPAETLRRCEASGSLTAGIGQIAASLAHMHVNRMLQDPSDEDELRIFDRLERLFRSEAARSRRADPRQPDGRPPAVPGMPT